MCDVMLTVAKERGCHRLAIVSALPFACRRDGVFAATTPRYGQHLARGHLSKRIDGTTLVSERCGCTHVGDEVRQGVLTARNERPYSWWWCNLRRYPSADEKVRTESLEIMGGGNCGNTLSA